MKTKKTMLGEMTYTEYADMMTALSHKEFLNVKETCMLFGIGYGRMYKIINSRSDLDLAYRLSDAPNAGYMIDREKFKDFIRNNKI